MDDDAAHVRGIAGPGAITAVVVQATAARNGILATVLLLAVIVNLYIKKLSTTRKVG